MENYFLYSYYDDNMNLIGVFDEDTPQDILEKAKDNFQKVRLFQYGNKN